MADSASESDSSSVADGPSMMPPTMPPSPITREQWHKRFECIQQQNRVLKAELETFKLRVKSLQEENRALRQASVNIQARAEQEEEYISNTLLKKIQALKKEKETLALNYEQEEECLTNDLSRKLSQLRQEKVELEQTLEQEQECLVNKLMRKIEKLETETVAKQNDLETLRREKIELENTLEQEQEALVNKLWKRMDKLEAEKRMLQGKLEQPISNPPSPADFNQGDRADNLSSHIQHLRNEVTRLRDQLSIAQEEHNRTTQQYVQEERLVKEENLRLQRKLQMEVERREALCRHLSESESSLEMEEERHYNEMTSHRHRTVSSPGPYNPSPNSSRPLSPGLSNFNPAREMFSTPSSLNRCPTCGQMLHHSPILHSIGGSAPPSYLPSTSPPPPAGYARPPVRQTQERFVKPIAPPPTTPLLMGSQHAHHPAHFSPGAQGASAANIPSSASLQTQTTSQSMT
ncbi:Coiled-coil domain-containing protein 6 [Armadillidium nasatum]|uniref:Coiled-coil domain-containing protein 6 n=1 Tax=Armadillidium nasatum TaxID=96803 RepID=A0A5N5T8A1_9CRUS|nr:Coiled-coil domain-containing protein 6 [Armadillidium nasatum]